MNLQLAMGERLRFARLALGLSKAELLRALGSHGRSSPTRWEGGVGATFIPPDVLVQLDRIYGITPSYLFTGRLNDLRPQLRDKILRIEQNKRAA